MTVESQVQKQNPGNIVSLFTLSTSNLGGSTTFNFTAMSRETTSVVFNGVTYTPIDIEAEGFEWDGKGAFPKPKLRVSNVAGLVSAAIVGENDLIGATLTRIKTFEEFLDDGANPDPNAKFPTEIYTIEQKLVQNKVYVEWQLSSSLDQADRKLPGRITLRDRCTQTYRVYDGVSNFNYTNVSCPYVGTNYFDTSGDVTTIDKDSCGRRLKDCKLRFGDFAELPTYAFPGIARTRSN